VRIVPFVWYGHRRFRQAPLLLVILVSWGMNLKEAFRGNCAASFGCTVAAVYFAFRF
jgi:uncharacterized protein (DUF486 family)